MILNLLFVTLYCDLLDEEEVEEHDEENDLLFSCLAFFYLLNGSLGYPLFS